MGYSSSGGPKGLGVFNNTPQTVADLNKTIELLARFAFIRSGDVDDQDALIGDALYEGLLFWRTDTRALEAYDGTGWDVILSDWQDYTPTVTGTNGGGTVTARWRRVGNTIEVVIKHVMAGANVTGAVRYSLPVENPDASVHVAGMALMRDISPGADYIGYVRLVGADAFIAPMGAAAAVVNFPGYLSSTFPFTWAVNDYLEARFSYEVG